ncbi:hypothetical protein D9M69_582340 [compost metagenome]
MTYFSVDRRWFTPWLILTWRTPRRLATRLASSCSAPNGHSQPQNAPRFQKTIEIAVAHHRMNTSGSIRKYSQRKSLRNAEKKVSTFTMDSWAWPYQPIQNSANARNASRRRSCSSGRLVSWSWKKKMPTSTSSATVRTATWPALPRQICFHSAGAGSSAGAAWAAAGAAAEAAAGCAPSAGRV